MKMKKTLGILMVLLLFATLFVACDNDDSDGAENLEIDMVVGFGAGGGHDMAARQLANELNKHGITANVINMAGGMGTEAAHHVSNQSPESNMFMWASPLIMNFEPAAGDRGFTIEDFEPIATFASPTFALASRSDAPWDTLDELIQYIKDNPGEVTFAGQGERGIMHFIVEKILDPNELDYTYVGMSGGSDVNLQLTGGHADVGHVSLAAARPLHQDGDLTVLVNTQILVERDPLMPDIPNVIEFDIDAREPITPLALFAPEGTPDEVKERIAAAMKEISADPDVVEEYENMGVIVHYLDSKDTEALFMDLENTLVPEYKAWMDSF